MNARGGEGEVDAAIERVVGVDRFVPGVGPARAVASLPSTASAIDRPSVQGRPGRRLDDHDAQIPLRRTPPGTPRPAPGTRVGPTGGVEREHDGVEVEAAQRLEEDDGHGEVMTGDTGESGVALLA